MVEDDPPGARRSSTFWHQGLLGTTVDVRVSARTPGEEARIDRSIVDEIVRLESVFSVFDAGSELSRWKRDELDIASPELVEVMSQALAWQARSGGAFNPMAGLVGDAWRRAVDDGDRPSSAELRRLVAAIREPRFEVSDGTLRRTADCTFLNLHAIAKGYIVDRAVGAAVDRYEPAVMLVGAGGDLLHRGSIGAQVGIENPLRPYDNEPPIVTVELRDAGLATSGGARRGPRLGSQRFSHLIDPRTGEAVAAQASISVVAPDAMTADVMATVLGLSTPDDSIRAVADFDRIGCFVIGPDGTTAHDPTWEAVFGGPAGR